MEAIEVMQRSSLQSLGEPRSIAVVGASHPGGSYHGAMLMANITGARTSAKVYPINPRYSGETMHGHQVYASLGDLPEVPDIVVFATRASVVSESLREAARLGVGTSVIITSADGDQAAFDAKVKEIADGSGMRVIGPNSMGIINGAAALNASFASGLGSDIPDGGIAFLSQSGAIISCMLQRDIGTNIGYSWLISTGNEAATSIEQLFDAIVDDVDVKVIMLFVEGVSDGHVFRRAALRAQAAGKPVVLLKAGVSESGRNAVQSHTGRMAGTKDVFRAVAEEAGVIQAQNFAELFSYSRALRDHVIGHRREAHARHAIVISNSGGLTTVAADHLSELGWQLPCFSTEVRQAVEREAQKKGVLNPADVPGSWVDNPRIARVMRAASKQPDVDAIFIVSGAGGKQAKNVASEILKAIPEIRQEVYVSWLGATDEMRKEYEDAGRTLYEDPWQAISAADTVASFRCKQTDTSRTHELLSALASVAANSTGAQQSLATLKTVSSNDVLKSARASGVPVVPTEVSSSLDATEVRAISDRFGYPVVLKIETDAISHKSDVNGVRVGVSDGDAVEDIVSDFAKIAADLGVPDARVLVQKMISGIEVLVGIKRDPAFGPVLFIGAGGVFAELQSELVGLPLPTVSAEIERKLAEHEVLAALLNGYRGSEACNRAALIDAIENIGNWALSFGPKLVEADFNPILVNSSAAFAVDARATIETSSGKGR